MSTHVEVTTCPITTLKHLFAGRNGENVVASTLGRRFQTSRFEHFTSLLVDESVDAIAAIINMHEDFVILATRRIQRVEVTVRSSLLESITQHHTILDNVELDGVASVLLCLELGEGGGHGVVSFADVISIGSSGAQDRQYVPVCQLSHGGSVVLVPIGYKWQQQPRAV